MFNILKELHQIGVLGINERIGRFILPHNKRADYPLVDNKILTAKRALEFGVKMPENFLNIDSFGELKNIGEKLLKFKSFVIKPAHGSQGNGIIVIKDVVQKDGEDYFVRSNNDLLSIDEITHHISSILSGLYSLSGQPDQAIIQEKIVIHPVFEKYSFGGIPDIRVIVYQGYPIMSMVRLPTRESNGRANLHQGAIGAGLLISTGEAINAVYKNTVVTHHPDTNHDIRTLQIPYWDDVLLLAAKCYEMVKMGYIGVDIVITPESGPILLELNARPGLGIQIANLSGLKPRLKLINSITLNSDPSERVKFAKLQFHAGFR
jgi:alpha-L-glutamate ligase-like protein